MGRCIRALYRTLGRMESEDLVVSERDGLDHGPTRRWYSITAPGESYLESWADSLARYQEEIGLFFALYEGAARGARRDARLRDGFSGAPRTPAGRRSGSHRRGDA